MTTSAAVPGTQVRVLDLTRRIAAGGIAGAAAGLLTGGIGGRLAMRMSALLDPSARGILTESGNRVGEITIGGTLGLLIFGGLLTGILAGVIWVIIRPWMPERVDLRIAATAVAALAFGGQSLIAGAERDFRILDSRDVNVTMFLGIVALIGALIPVFDRMLQRRLPSDDGWIALYAPIVGLGVLLGVPLFVGAMFSAGFCECDDPPRLAGAFLAATAVCTGIAEWGWIRGRGPASPRLRIAGTGALVVAVGAGLVPLVATVTDLL